MDEKNVFDRRLERKLSNEDTRNAFDRAQAARNAARSDTVSHEKRVASREAQRAAWVGDSRKAGGVRATATVLDSKTAELKKASDASRKAARRPQPVGVTYSTDDIEAWTNLFQLRHPEFYASQFNCDNLSACLLTNIAAGKLLWSYQSFEQVYSWLAEHGYFEEAPQAVRTRGDVGRPAPKTFPPYIPPHIQEEQQREAALARAIQADEEEQVARKINFAELQRAIRAGFRTAPPLDAAIGGRSY